MAIRYTRPALYAAAIFALAAAPPALAADDTSMKQSQETSGSQTSAATGSKDTGKSGSASAKSSKAASPELKSTLAKIHMANAMEIEAGRLAQEKAQDEKVKEFAEKMVDDHSAADERVMEIAEENNVSLADAKATDKHKKHHLQQLDKLRAMDGAQFDKAYMNMMAKDHTKVLNELKAAQKSAKNEDLKALLDELVPKIEEHATTAKQLVASAGQGGQTRQGRRPSDQGASRTQESGSGASMPGQTQGGSMSGPDSSSRNTDQGSGATDDLPGGTNTGQTGDTGQRGSGSGGGGK